MIYFDIIQYETKMFWKFKTMYESVRFMFGMFLFGYFYFILISVEGVLVAFEFFTTIFFKDLNNLTLQLTSSVKF